LTKKENWQSKNPDCSSCWPPVWTECYCRLLYWDGNDLHLHCDPLVY